MSWKTLTFTARRYLAYFFDVPLTGITSMLARKKNRQKWIDRANIAAETPSQQALGILIRERREQEVAIILYQQPDTVIVTPAHVYQALIYMPLQAVPLVHEVLKAVQPYRKNDYSRESELLLADVNEFAWSTRNTEMIKWLIKTDTETTATGSLLLFTPSVDVNILLQFIDWINVGFHLTEAVFSGNHEIAEIFLQKALDEDSRESFSVLVPSLLNNLTDHEKGRYRQELVARIIYWRILITTDYQELILGNAGNISLVGIEALINALIESQLFGRKFFNNLRERVIEQGKINDQDNSTRARTEKIISMLTLPPSTNNQ
jgi:hypothetical protein